MTNYATLDDIKLSHEKDVEVEGKVFRVRAVMAERLLAMTGDAPPDGATPQEAAASNAANAEKLTKNVDAVIVDGLVNPPVDVQSVKVLGRFRMPLFKAIMDLSGLSEEASTRYKFLS